MKIAVTTSNGEFVDTEYKAADMIFIFDIVEKEVISVEKRRVPHKEFEHQDHTLSWSTFEKVYETVKDCKILITQRIKPIPIQRFKSFGIKVKQAEGEIIGILDL